MDAVGYISIGGFVGLLVGMTLGFVLTVRAGVQNAEMVKAVSTRDEEIKRLHLRLKDMHGRYINIVTVAERRAAILTSAIKGAIGDYESVSLLPQDAQFSKRLYTEDCERAEAFFKATSNAQKTNSYSTGKERTNG